MGAELDVLLIVYTGSEHAVPILDANLAHPRKLILALEQRRCTAIAVRATRGNPLTGSTVS